MMMRTPGKEGERSQGHSRGLSSSQPLCRQSWISRGSGRGWKLVAPAVQSRRLAIVRNGCYFKEVQFGFPAALAL